MDTPSLSLHAKLRTALITTCRTLILGSSERATDFEKTNGWCAEVQDKVRKNTDRFYQCYPLSPEEDPLKRLQPYFIRSLIKEYKVVLNNERVGNCGERARFIALYLWQHAGQFIHRIEIVSAQHFDHAWVIVNRNKESNLLKPEEWGDAWVVDAWWGDEGTYYHTSDYHQKMIELLAYVKEQNEALYKKNRIQANTLENFNEVYEQYLKDFKTQSLKVPLNVKHQPIYPQEMPYPVDNQKMRSLEDYYDYCPYDFSSPNFGFDDCRTKMITEKSAHQQCFLPCLDQIKSRGYIQSIAAVEEKFLKLQPKFEM